jgi:mannose-6-phosphate isomerase
MIVRTDKPWGYEELLERNEFYVLKRLFMRGGHCCSLQYHEKKHETIYILSGEMRLIYGDTVDSIKEIFLTSGQYYVIPPIKIHRMCGETGCLYLESSTTQLDDVVRVEDDYGRK